MLDDPSRVRISSELTNLENDLSSYLGESLKSASEKNISISNVSKESETKFFNEIVINGNFSNAEAQQLAEIEVNFAHGVAEAVTAHNRLTCPICQANGAADSSGIAQELPITLMGVQIRILHRMRVPLKIIISYGCLCECNNLRRGIRFTNACKQMGAVCIRDAFILVLNFPE